MQTGLGPQFSMLEGGLREQTFEDTQRISLRDSEMETSSLAHQASHGVSGPRLQGLELPDAGRI